uniref:Candidate secreted effector n=1 Tax=Meloidogyne incognita TaxID=6306 RepID=A0A914KWE1_MELIC
MPLIPGKPGSPIIPCPSGPIAPGCPGKPGSPLTPGYPSMPLSPDRPGNPCSPFSPGIPGEPGRNTTLPANRYIIHESLRHTQNCARITNCVVLRISPTPWLRACLCAPSNCPSMDTFSFNSRESRHTISTSFAGWSLTSRFTWDSGYSFLSRKTGLSITRQALFSF